MKNIRGGASLRKSSVVMRSSLSAFIFLLSAIKGFSNPDYYSLKGSRAIISSWTETVPRPMDGRCAWYPDSDYTDRMHQHYINALKALFAKNPDISYLKLTDFAGTQSLDPGEAEKQVLHLVLSKFKKLKIIEEVTFLFKADFSNLEGLLNRYLPGNEVSSLSRLNAMLCLGDTPDAARMLSEGERSTRFLSAVRSKFPQLNELVMVPSEDGLILSKPEWLRSLENISWHNLELLVGTYTFRNRRQCIQDCLSMFENEALSDIAQACSVVEALRSEFSDFEKLRAQFNALLEKEANGELRIKDPCFHDLLYEKVQKYTPNVGELARLSNEKEMVGAHDKLLAYFERQFNRVLNAPISRIELNLR